MKPLEPTSTVMRLALLAGIQQFRIPACLPGHRCVEAELKGHGELDYDNGRLAPHNDVRTLVSTGNMMWEAVLEIRQVGSDGLA